MRKKFVSTPTFWIYRINPVAVLFASGRGRTWNVWHMEELPGGDLGKARIVKTVKRRKQAERIARETASILKQLNREGK